MSDDKERAKDPAKRTSLPLLPLRDVVVFPHVVVPLYVGRPFSVAALEKAADYGEKILLVAQREPDTESPDIDELFSVGCVAKVLQRLQLADGSIKTLVEGVYRANILKIRLDKKTGMQIAEFEKCKSVTQDANDATKALAKTLKQQFLALSKMARTGELQEFPETGNELTDLCRLTDFIAYSMPADVDERQEYLEIMEVNKRAEQVLAQIARLLDIGKIERKIRGRLKSQIDKSQREFYLNEKVKAIQKELGDDGSSDVNDLRKKVKAAGMTEQARNKCLAELRKLSHSSMMSAEAGVVRSYVETLLSLPWKKRDIPNSDLLLARTILDEDHYGLEKIKERIIEYLAVQQRVAQPKGSILCLVGPPGVGKTSLGHSIARATGRKFVRIALGGVRDEAEIRGHRRTYVASMPGRVLQGMIRAKVKNPVFMLDEIDKMGMDIRGDPASALLEVLDPEQNCNFVDHYAEIDYNLAEVTFITTSNSYNIPPALLDRLEIIPVSGYTETEKIMIAKQHLVPKQLVENGIPAAALSYGDTALREIIRLYTREAGVRQLERSISKICRKTIVEQMLHQANNAAKSPEKKTAEQPDTVAVAEPKKGKHNRPRGAKGKGKSAFAKAKPEVPPFSPETVTIEKVRKYLGPAKYRAEKTGVQDKVGQVNGLAWTETGGDMLSIEAIKMPGRGKIVRTGTLGDVMKESITAAHSLVRARAQNLGIDSSFHKKYDMHIHMPEGGIPKDGPSAGCAVVCAMVSALSDQPVRADTAMTGEITLRGEVLPVGGIKEKLLAAVRNNISRVILPEENRKDVVDLPDEIHKAVEIIHVRWIDDVFAKLLCKFPLSTESTAGTPAVKARGKTPPPAIPPHTEKEQSVPNPN